MFAKQPHLLSNRKFLLTAGLASAFGLIFLFLNLFLVGGDEFIYALNNNINFPLALLVSAAAVSVWRTMSAEKRSRALWTGLLLGWTLWALAEGIWLGYSLIGQEVPYPSLADVFWLAGYIPMMGGLVGRARAMPAKPNPLQALLILLLASVTSLLAVLFILIPLLQNFSPREILANIPNFLYPLADLAVVSVVWRILFTYEEGDYGFAWKLLMFGFMFVTVSDLMYAYATLQEVYYPDMRANFISRFVDVLYAGSYWFWLLGIYVLSSLRKEEEKPVVEETPAPKVRIVRNYGHILVYTQSDDSVLEISPNFGGFFEDENVVGKSFAEALTLSPQNARQILDKLRAEGRIADFPVQIRNRSGSAQEVRISGLAITNSQKGYLGSNLLLRMRVADKSFDERLDSSSRAMIRFLLEKSGSSNKAEIAQFLADYYLAYFRALLEMASRQGGAALTQALLEALSEAAQTRGWQMRFNPQTILDPAEYPLETLREALPALLETAKKFVSNVADAGVVETRMKEVASRFSETVRRDIERYQRAGSEVPLADGGRKVQAAQSVLR